MIRTTMACLALTTLFWMSGAAAPTSAQVPVEPGESVRVWIDGQAQPVEGVFSLTGGGGMELRTSDGEVVPVDPQRISLTQRQVSATHGGLGAVVGSVLGLALGIVLFDDSCDGAPADDLGTALAATLGECVESAFVGGVLVPAGTTVAGGALGYLLGRSIQTTGWVPAVIPLRGDAAVTVSWSVPFG